MVLPSPDTVADELAIKKVLSKVARAQDDRDVESYRSCFMDEVTVHMPMLPGWTPTRMSADELMKIAISVLHGFDVTHHRVFNELIWVDGDTARCEADVSAYHQIIEGDDESSLTIGGRYIHTFKRDDTAGWLIAERALRVRYQIGDKSLFDRARTRSQAQGH
jgi:hypothetical protein